MQPQPPGDRIGGLADAGCALGTPGATEYPLARGGCRSREEAPMKVWNSLRALKQKDESRVVRRHGRTVIANGLHPRWKARQR
jgi:ribosomal protein L36